MFVELVALCFKTDEKIFGNRVKEIRGVDDGTPYTMKYIPSKAINGDYTVDVRYGIMSGMNPNNATVALLQMRSDKLISRDYVRRELPIEINVTQEEQKVDIEEMRDALRAAIGQTALAIPQMIAQGQDPSKILGSFAEMIKGRQKGLTIENVVEKAFAPEPQPEAAAMQPQAPVAGMAPASALQPSMEQPGGAAPAAGGPQGAPQGKPDIASLLASIGGAA
jgi:hypothetical protein